MSKPVFEDIFTFSGRRNRKSYLFYLLTLICFVLIVAFMSTLLGIWLYLLFVPLSISALAVAAQRCRDFGWTGWAVLISLIPYLGGLFSLVIIFVPGTVGQNRYGTDCMENGLIESQ